jgi:hypothetical protein
LKASLICPSVTAQHSLGTGPTSPFKFTGCLTCHASGSAPAAKFLAAYQAARREFFRDVAAVVGGGVLILDTDLKKQRGYEVIAPPTQH